MAVHFQWSALKQSRRYEYALRFVLGGLATVLTGAIAAYFGPATGGLFLAFPVIFCASATLIESHERERKARLGLCGTRRGTDAAALDASGAGLGSIGVAAFGLCVWLLAPSIGFAALPLASVAWLLVSVLLWRVRREIRLVR
jgi:hypothetical protein